jgi:dTDP-4-amino-4,6-dideoxygalactose transaminase
VKVSFSDLAALHRPLRLEIDRAIAEVVDSNQFINGPQVAGFENELAHYCGVKHAVGVSSGTDALVAALMALGVGVGDQVITTPFSFFASVGAIVRVGATPVFADIDPATLLIDAEAAAAAVGAATRAAIPVHLFGARATISLPAEVVVIEDAAQAIGTGPPRGRCATLSFFPAKNLGALGDGGAVLSDDEDFAEQLMSVRAHGAKPKYVHHRVGGNFRLDALQAAVLRVKLRHLDQWTEARRQCAARYRELFAASEVTEVQLPPTQPGHVYNQFVIQVSRRDQLKQHLNAAGVASAIYYPGPLHLQPCFGEMGWRSGMFPVAEKACERVLALPVHPTLTAAEQEHVVATVAQFFGR